MSYFVIIEVRQFRESESASEHFCDPWNYLDIIPPILIVITEIIHFSGPLEGDECLRMIQVHDEEGNIKEVEV